MNSQLAAIIFAIFTTLVILFQLGLAAGMPWGTAAMGGKFPGRFPTQMRVAALVQAAVLAGLGAVVLTRARLILPGLYLVSTWLVWGVVAFTVLSLVMNLITPSKWERIIWAPVVTILLVCSVLVGLG